MGQIGRWGSFFVQIAPRPLGQSQNKEERAANEPTSRMSPPFGTKASLETGAGAKPAPRPWLSIPASLELYPQLAAYERGVTSLQRRRDAGDSRREGPRIQSGLDTFSPQQPSSAAECPRTTRCWKMEADHDPTDILVRYYPLRWNGEVGGRGCRGGDERDWCSGVLRDTTGQAGADGI